MRVAASRARRRADGLVMQSTKFELVIRAQTARTVEFRRVDGSHSAKRDWMIHLQEMTDRRSNHDFAFSENFRIPSADSDDSQQPDALVVGPRTAATGSSFGLPWRVSVLPASGPKPLPPPLWKAPKQQICCNDGEVLIEVRLIGCVCRPFHGSEWMAKRGCNDDPRHQCAGDPAGLDADQDRLNRRTAQSPQSDSLARSAPRRRSDQVHEAFGAWVIDDA
jgi:hypothetical protein